jgi:hypothetical protein
VLHDVRVRFEATRALDAVERRLATDPLLTGGIVDVAEAIRLVDLDGGRPVSLLRLGLLIDALARLLGDGGVAIYPVAERGLLSDTELTSNERMVLRRWSDDGLLELLPAGAPVLARAAEIAALTGQPVLTRAQVRGYALAPRPDGGGAALVPAGPAPAAQAHPALNWLWRCPVPDCASFGQPATGGGPGGGAGQPPPALGPSGTPTCPRHGERLTEAGPRPASVAMVARVDGLVRHRFAVGEGAPVLVGRSPDEPGSVVLGPHLGERALGWVSRRHLTLELRGDTVYATDFSTNGTVAVGPAGRTRLVPRQPHRLADGESLELYEGVELARPGGVSAAGAAPGSVMAEAPTVAMRLPRGL